jgi:hypothetical protein
MQLTSIKKSTSRYVRFEARSLFGTEPSEESKHLGFWKLLGCREAKFGIPSRLGWGWLAWTMAKYLPCNIQASQSYQRE